MTEKQWKIYLSGEVHSDWREKLTATTEKSNLPVTFFSPITDHDASDNCGVRILGDETEPFWKDHQGASLNAIRTRTLIADSDLVIVRFGEKYQQWNAAFDAGYAAALGKPLIIQHSPEHIHALKEIDAAALAVVETDEGVASILRYVIAGELPAASEQ